jgi:hypothetical protein
MQEITALANCQCEQITKYYDSFILPNSSKLLIAMELMACSGSDLVRFSDATCSSMTSPSCCLCIPSPIMRTSLLEQLQSGWLLSVL